MGDLWEIGALVFIALVAWWLAGRSAKTKNGQVHAVPERDEGTQDHPPVLRVFHYGGKPEEDFDPSPECCMGESLQAMLDFCKENGHWMTFRFEHIGMQWHGERWDVYRAGDPEPLYHSPDFYKALAVARDARETWTNTGHPPAPGTYADSDSGV